MERDCPPAGPAGSNDDGDDGAPRLPQPTPPTSALGSIPVVEYDAGHLCGHCGDRRSFTSATVYCPSTGGSLPSVVLVGGWLCGERVLAAWGPYLASHGIVAMTVGTPAPHRDMPEDRCRALLDAGRALQTEHGREGSGLFGRLDPSRRAVMGYSLGGGGAQLAALADPELKCAIALAPHSGKDFGARFPDKLTDSVPTLFLVGSADKEAPARDMSRPHYDMTGAPSLLLEIAGGDHYVVNGPTGGNERDFNGDAELGLCVNAVCSMFCGLAPCGGYGHGTGPSGVAAAGAARGAIGEVALAWLRLFLQGDEGARPRLLERPGIASGFESKGVRPEDMERL